MDNCHQSDPFDNVPESMMTPTEEMGKKKKSNSQLSLPASFLLSFSQNRTLVFDSQIRLMSIFPSSSSPSYFSSFSYFSFSSSFLSSFGILVRNTFN